VIVTVIPAYNEPPARVLAAVQSAASVSDAVVVADDGSRDPIKCEGAIVVRQHNKGPAAAMNLGADEALRLGATRIARLDVGDRFLTEAKLRQLARTEPALASWHFDLVGSNLFKPPASWQNRIYTDGAFCICTCVVSADVWREVGGFDESLRYGDDWDWSMRVQHAVGWTMHEESTCEAGAFEGGHTKSADADPIKRELKHQCLVRCLEMGRRLKQGRRA
jgi:glycosyltransferase involved in cell wall biosynthesis